ncbi:transcriptional regulator ATRX isoform X2, partial [Clarias magur]
MGRTDCSKRSRTNHCKAYGSVTVRALARRQATKEHHAPVVRPDSCIISLNLFQQT